MSPRNLLLLLSLVTLIPIIMAFVPMNCKSKKEIYFNSLLYSSCDVQDNELVYELQIKNSIKQAKSPQQIHRILHSKQSNRDTAKTQNTTIISLKNHDMNYTSQLSNYQAHGIESVDSALQHHDTNRNNNDNSNLQLLFHHDNPNITAYSLRALAKMALIQSRSSSTSIKNDLQSTQSLLAELLQKLGKLIVINDRLLDNTTTDTATDTKSTRSYYKLGIHALADTLDALSIMSQRQQSMSKKFQPFGSKIIKLMILQQDVVVSRLGFVRLVQILQAIANLQLWNNDTRDFWNIICQRLLQGDALSKLNAKSMSYGLDAIAYVIRSNSPWEERDKSCIQLSLLFLRRLRKPNVRQNATISDFCRTISALDRLVNYDQPLEDFSKLVKEVPLFAFIIVDNTLHISNARHDGTIQATWVPSVVCSWSKLKSKNHMDRLSGPLLDHFEEYGHLNEFYVNQLGPFVKAMEDLQETARPKTIQMIGERLLKSIMTPSNNVEINPESVNSLLRHCVLFYRRDTAVMEPYLIAAQHLFSDKSFLATCKILELSNFLWFLSGAHLYNEQALERLARRILETDIKETCTPKYASRILSTYTTITTFQGDALQMKQQQLGYHSTSEEEQNGEIPIVLQELSLELFEELGGHLLSSRLSPAETTAALCAYARASYVRDMGIFDHLVSLVASFRAQCTTRQLSQALWSCGHMMKWEEFSGTMNDYDANNNDGSDDDDATNESQDTPFLQDAERILEEIATRTLEMSTFDVAQCIWATGRLYNHNNNIDMKLIDKLVSRANELQTQFNSAELANIIWGLGKIKHFRNKKFIESMANQMISLPLRQQSNNKNPSTQEISNVLFTMGKLKIRNVDIFAQLSAILMNDISLANSQSIANVLWAHRVVHIAPPKQLFDTWATKKLGIVGIQKRIKN